MTGTGECREEVAAGRQVFVGREVSICRRRTRWRRGCEYLGGFGGGGDCWVAEEVSFGRLRQGG